MSDLRLGRPVTPAERTELDRAVAESRERVHQLNADPELTPAAAQARKEARLGWLGQLRQAEEEARRARQTMARFDREACTARENGTTMPAEFWEAFGAAWTSVRMAERDVAKAREKTR